MALLKCSVKKDQRGFFWMVTPLMHKLELCHYMYGVWHLQTADRRLQTADFRPQTADHRSTADCRPQIADCKLKDTKNLPNKGDTIKNITLCESEKVAKLASFPRCCWLFFTDATLYWLTRHITNCVDSLFFFDYCELIITSSNAN